MNTVQPLIEQDWEAFRPGKVTPVRHRLSSHPLLQFDQLLKLGERRHAEGQLHEVKRGVTAGTPFEWHRGAVETLRRMHSEGGWTILRFIQHDPVYRELVDAVLDSIKPYVERKDPGMYGRAGFIFVSAQNVVTPFHMDPEQNFLLQIQGRKRAYVWDPDDEEVVSAAARDRFHHDGNRDLMPWHEEFRQRAHVFDLEPGQGVYMPMTSPHMTETGGELSITMSMTYYTRATRRISMQHKLRYLCARRAHIILPEVGKHPVLDRMSRAALESITATRRVGQQIVRRKDIDPTPPYAQD